MMGDSYISHETLNVDVTINFISYGFFVALLVACGCLMAHSVSLRIEILDVVSFTDSSFEFDLLKFSLHQ